MIEGGGRRRRQKEQGTRYKKEEVNRKGAPTGKNPMFPYGKQGIAAYNKGEGIS